MGIIYIILLINALIGAYGFNWAWKKIKPLRDADPKRDDLFPSFNRTDVHLWSPVKFFLGAITFMPFRFSIGLGIVLFLFVYIK